MQYEILLYLGFIIAAYFSIKVHMNRNKNENVHKERNMTNRTKIRRVKGHILKKLRNLMKNIPEKFDEDI